MNAALILAICTFVASWLIHLIIWRIHRPKAYPKVLPAIFILTPLVAGLLLYAGGLTRELPHDPLVLVAAMLLHLALGACYTCGYAGIIEYSPSAEILQVVAKHMPRGVEPGKVSVPSLSEQALTGKRIAHLLESNMAETRDGKLTLTPNGRRVMAFWRRYRAVFGIAQTERGLRK